MGQIAQRGCSWDSKKWKRTPLLNHIVKFNQNFMTFLPKLAFEKLDS